MQKNRPFLRQVIWALGQMTEAYGTNDGDIMFLDTLKQQAQRGLTWQK